MISTKGSGNLHQHAKAVRSCSCKCCWLVLSLVLLPPQAYYYHYKHMEIHYQCSSKPAASACSPTSPSQPSLPPPIIKALLLFLFTLLVVAFKLTFNVSRNSGAF